MRPFLNSISKAKAARLVRSLLDLFLDMEAATGQEVRQLEFSSRPASYKSRVVLVRARGAPLEVYIDDNLQAVVVVKVLEIEPNAIFSYKVDLCLECIEWAKSEKRTFLRQALEVR